MSKRIFLQCFSMSRNKCITYSYFLRQGNFSVRLRLEIKCITYSYFLRSDNFSLRLWLEIKLILGRTWTHDIRVHSYLAWPSSHYWFVMVSLNSQYKIKVKVIACHSTCMQNACVTSGVHAKALHKYKRRLEGLVSI